MSLPTGRRLKVIADRAACCGYGICAGICPSVYKLDANGIVYLDDDIVPVGDEQAAREAAESCPQSALAVEEIDA